MALPTEAKWMAKRALEKFNQYEAARAALMLGQI
jgi:hypothetical protein